jgi:hypothetical protein
VAMQVVFPLFLLWLVSLFYFICYPLEKRAQVGLALVSALSLYVYTYLTQIIVVSSGIGLCCVLLKDFRIYKTAVYSAVGASVLSIPFLIYTWKQIHHPFYFETLARIGLVETHTIGSAAMFYMLMIGLISAIIWFQRNFYTKQELSVFVLVSAGLFITTVSNVISGKDLEVAVHIGRFVELWAGIVFVVIVSRMMVFDQKKVVYMYIGLLCVCLMYVGLVQVRVWKSINKDILVDQRYKTVLQWLRENTPTDSVVFTDDRLASYIPIETSNYVLFSPNSLLYLASDKEVEDRYLLSRVFMDASIDDIKKDMRKYAGAGYTAHRHMIHNRNVRLCKFIVVDLWKGRCGEYTDQYVLKGESYFGSLEVRHLYMQEHAIDELKKFNVSYIIVDKNYDSWNVLNTLQRIWSDNYFDIYKMN